MTLQCTVHRDDETKRSTIINCHYHNGCSKHHNPEPCHHYQHKTSPNPLPLVFRLPVQSKRDHLLHELPPIISRMDMEFYEATLGQDTVCVVAQVIFSTELSNQTWAIPRSASATGYHTENTVGTLIYRGSPISWVAGLSITTTISAERASACHIICAQ